MTSQGSIKAFPASTSCENTLGETFTGTLDLNVCTQNSIGGNSLEIIQLPSCADGDNAQLQLYDSSECQGTPYATGNKTNQCLALEISANGGSLLFVCVDSRGNVVNSASLTSSAFSSSSSTALATPLAGASITSSSPRSTTTPSHASTNPTLSSTQTSSTSSVSISSSFAAAASPTNSHGLSTSDKIALGVGLGTGLPAVFLAAAGLYYTIKTYWR